MKTLSSCGLSCAMLQPIAGTITLWKRGSEQPRLPAARPDHQAISLLLFEHISAFLCNFFKIMFMLWLSNGFSSMPLYNC